MTRAVLVLGVAAASLVGCAVSEPLLKNPKTGQVIRCETSPFNGWYFSKQRLNEECARALEKDGWVRLGP